MVFAGEVYISLVSEGAGGLSQDPRTPRVPLKGGPRPVLLLPCLMSCWRAEAELAQALEAGQAIPHQTLQSSGPVTQFEMELCPRALH